MAERRMFAKTIIDSDAFLDMSISARLLYYDLAMRADDDGFVNSPKKIMRIVGASLDDLRALIERKFIIPFDNGVVVIKHWRIHNYIRKDTYSETKYKEQKEALELDENGSYRLIRDDSSTERPRLVNDQSTQDRIGKDRIGKDRLGKFVPPTLEEVQAYCAERNSPVDPQRFYDYFTTGNWKDAKGNPVKNWKQKLITWERSGNQTTGKKHDSVEEWLHGA